MAAKKQSVEDRRKFARTSAIKKLEKAGYQAGTAFEMERGKGVISVVGHGVVMSFDSEDEDAVTALLDHARSQSEGG